MKYAACLPLLWVVSSACAPEITVADGASGSAGTGATSAAGTSASASSSASGGASGTSGGGGSIGGSAPFKFDHEVDLKFDKSELTDPNIWDLTNLDGRLYAAVVSGELDAVAEIEADGTVTNLFFTPFPIGMSLADDAQHLVLDDEVTTYVMTPAGALEATYTCPVQGGLRASAGIGTTIYELGVGADETFGVQYLDLDSGAIGLAFAIDTLPDFLAAWSNMLIVGSYDSSGINDPPGCLSLRFHLVDGTLQKELCIEYPFEEVNGIAFDGKLLAVSDHSAGKVHFFAPTENF